MKNKQNNSRDRTFKLPERKAILATTKKKKLKKPVSIRSLKKEKKKLEDELEETYQAANLLRAGRNDLNNKLAERDGQLAIKDSEIETLKAEADISRHANKLLRESKHELNGRIVELESQIAVKDEELEAARVVAEGLTTQVRSLERQLVNERREFETRRTHQLNLVRASREEAGHATELFEDTFTLAIALAEIFLTAKDGRDQPTKLELLRETCSQLPDQPILTKGVEEVMAMVLSVASADSWKHALPTAGLLFHFRFKSTLQSMVRQGAKEPSEPAPTTPTQTPPDKSAPENLEGR